MTAPRIHEIFLLHNYAVECFPSTEQPHYFVLTFHLRYTHSPTFNGIKQKASATKQKASATK